MHFKLLPWCWSPEGVSLHKSLVLSPKSIVQCLPPSQLPLVFVARSYGDLSSWHWNSGLSDLVWGAGIPHSWDVPPNFYPPHVGVGPPISCLMSPTPSSHLNDCDFFNSLVVRLPYSSIFWWFWVVVVSQFSCNFCHDWARRLAVFMYASILTRSLNLF